MSKPSTNELPENKQPTIDKQPTIEQYINELYLFITYIDRGFIKGAFVIEDTGGKIKGILKTEKKSSSMRPMMNCISIHRFFGLTHNKFIDSSAEQSDRYIRSDSVKKIPDPNVDDILFTIDSSNNNIIPEIKRIIKFYSFEIKKKSYVYIKLEEYRTFTCGERTKHWEKWADRHMRFGKTKKRKNNNRRTNKIFIKTTIINNADREENQKKKINITAKIIPKDGNSETYTRREDETYSKNMQNLRDTLYKKDIEEMEKWVERNKQKYSIETSEIKKSIEKWYNMCKVQPQETNQPQKPNQTPDQIKKQKKMCKKFEKSRFEFFIPLAISNILFDNCNKEEKEGNETLYPLEDILENPNKTEVIKQLIERKNNKIKNDITYDITYEDKTRKFLKKNCPTIYKRWKKSWENAYNKRKNQEKKRKQIQTNMWERRRQERDRREQERDRRELEHLMRRRRTKKNKR